MYKLKLVVLGSEGEIEQEIPLNFDSMHLNIIDRPAFCIYRRTNANGYDNLLFKFSNIDEIHSCQSNDDSMIAYYGKISGCLYSLAFKKEYYNKKELLSLFNKIHKIGNLRFNKNVKNYFNMAEVIIKTLNQPK